MKNNIYTICNSTTFLTFLILLIMNKKTCNMKLCWIVTIWPKWQIVIPKDVREKLGLETWNTLAVILKDDKYIWFVKNEDIGDVMKYIESENK